MMPDMVKPGACLRTVRRLAENILVNEYPDDAPKKCGSAPADRKHSSSRLGASSVTGSLVTDCNGLILDTAPCEGLVADTGNAPLPETSEEL